MSEIARRLTGLSAKELFEYDFPSANSADDAIYPRGVEVRQSVRAFAGLIIGPGDLNKERERLKKNIPPALVPSKK